MPGESTFKVYSAYAAWTVANLVLTGLTFGLFFWSWPQHINVKKSNLLSYYPHFWNANSGLYHKYDTPTKFTDGTDLTLKELADPGKCGAAEAGDCYGNDATVTTRMWYTYRFSEYYTIDNAPVEDSKNNSIMPMFVHNGDKNASVSKHAWADGIEGDRIYSPAECYELVRSYYHIFQAQTIIMGLFVLYHFFILFGYRNNDDEYLEDVIPKVFDVSVVVYGIAWFHFWHLMLEVNENRKHCAHLSGWFGNSNHSMHTYVALNLSFYLLSFILALVTAFVFKISIFQDRKGSRAPATAMTPMPNPAAGNTPFP